MKPPPESCCHIRAMPQFIMVPFIIPILTSSKSPSIDRTMHASPVHHLHSSILMAPPRHLLLLPLLVVFLFPASNATQPPRTIHVPVVHRDAVFLAPPDAQRGSLLSSRLAADAALTSTTSLGSSTAHSHLLRSPVISGPRFKSGEYFALVGVGTPPTSALLVIDTGSDLVWLQCKPCRHCYDQASPLYDPRGSSTYRQIPCSSPQCPRRLEHCDSSTGGCRYAIVYGDGSATTGNLATDRLVFSNDTSVHTISLGCGHDDEGLFESAAGLLGLSRANNSFATQVAASYGRYFTYCLGHRTPRERNGASYLVFGRTPELPFTVFTPLLSNPQRPNFYYVNMTGFSVDGKRVTGFSSSSLSLNPVTGQGGVVVDSGTSISRFARDAYAALRGAFDARAAQAGMRRLARDQVLLRVFDACYDLGGTATANVDVPRIMLHLAGGADMALPVDNYFIPMGNGGRWRDYYCLALEAAGDGLSVLGNVQQQGFRVVFDVENERVGFAPNGCPV